MKTCVFAKRAGQNTVEYLLMLSVLVGAVLITGTGMKRFMPQLFEQISAKITNATGQLGGGGGD